MAEFTDPKEQKCAVKLPAEEFFEFFEFGKSGVMQRMLFVEPLSQPAHKQSELEQEFRYFIFEFRNKFEKYQKL